MGVVTYKGPKDSHDPTTHYVVPPGEGERRKDIVLPRDVAVDDVPEAIVKALRKVEDHEFDFGKPSGEGDG